MGAMSASRRLRRQQSREAARVAPPTPPAVVPGNSVLLARLRRRVRIVLLLTTLIGLVLLRLFNKPVAELLLHYGLTARLALVLVLLSPALFTWLIGVGQIKDEV